MTLDELAKAIDPIPPDAMATFISRGMLLSKRTALESARANTQAEKEKVALEYNTKLADIDGQIAVLQKEIDALPG